MASTESTDGAAPGSARRPNSKVILWGVLLVAAVWVFFSNEVALLFDYPLYHSYRELMISDRLLLIPHALFGLVAFVVGPLQFSSRIRQRNLPMHRILGRVYVVSVYCAALFALVIARHRGEFPGTATQAGAWIVTTTVAWITAKNGHVGLHRQWVARSYAVTFTFVSLRLLSIWPAYWNLPDEPTVLTIIITSFASVLVADLITGWREITHRRS